MGSIYEIVFAKSVKSYYDSCNDEIKNQFRNAIEEIRINPYGINNFKIKKMRGTLKNNYRYRFSDYRIVYSIDKNKIIVSVSDFGPRGDVYK